MLKVLLIKVSGQPFDVNLIQIHARTAESTVLEEFYTYTKEVQKHMKNTNVNISMGDRNTKAEKVNGVIWIGYQKRQRHKVY